MSQNKKANKKNNTNAKTSIQQEIIFSTSELIKEDVENVQQDKFDQAKVIDFVDYNKKKAYGEVIYHVLNFTPSF